MKTIVNNLAVEYIDEGSGPTILMLHGWKDTLHTFDPLLREFSGQYRIIRLDLPGFGASQMPPRDWDLQDYVDFVCAFIEKQNLTIDILVGHSFGGRITIKGVSNMALKPQKIVLIAAAGLAQRRTTRNAILAFVAKVGKVVTAIPPLSFWRKDLRRRLYEHVGRDYFASGALRGTFLKIVGEDLANAAANIKIPTLLIWGSEDDQTPLEEGRRIHEIIKGSQLETFQNAGHFVHKERPEQVARRIELFI